MDQRQDEVTSSGRVWYIVDGNSHVVWIKYAGRDIPRPPIA